jgi:hypothetical protein
MESVVPKGAASGIAGSDAFADRCWLAWHALPRREGGKPPSWRSLELANGLPALLAVKARNVPRPLLAGLAGVVGLLVYGTLAARVDGRFAWLASAFTVPMALIPRRK